MSELALIRSGAEFRWQLLTTASALVLVTYAASTPAIAEDTTHPTVWIELGGAFDQLSAGSERWLPPNLTPSISNPPPGPFGKMPAKGYDTDLKFSLQPEGSDWVFSASIRYGRAARGPKRTHDQSYNVKVFHTSYPQPTSKYFLTNYADSNSAQKSRESHTILDFKAGKDLGLGILGGQSVVSAGVRVAKLNDNADGQLTAFISAPAKYNPGEVVHKAAFDAAHSLNAIGPSISWDASVPFAGSLSDGFSLDWGVNAAILFGRQKSRVSLLTKNTQYFAGRQNALSYSTENPVRSRSAIVPNLGGFAGLSWRLPSAKISLGYRGDFFFNAVDSGIDARKTHDRAFYGPFANVSIGLGG